MVKVKRNLGRGAILWVAFGIAVILAGGFIFVQFISPGFGGPATEDEGNGQNQTESQAEANGQKPIIGLRFTQTKAVPNYDDSEYELTDSERLATFAELIKTYDIDVTSDDLSGDDGCDGGVSSDVALRYNNGDNDQFSMYDCGGSGDEAEFVGKATDLLSSWKE